MPVVPTSTYRVQLTSENGFASLGAMAEHLANLGVSHAYLSPVLQAAPGSRHGYDVIDHGRVDEGLGGEAGLRAAAEQLHGAGVGAVLDTVPNHMARGTPESLNRMLWAVLRDGPTSAHASWFDVDWESGQLLLPCSVVPSRSASLPVRSSSSRTVGQGANRSSATTITCCRCALGPRTSTS